MTGRRMRIFTRLLVTLCFLGILGSELSLFHLWLFARLPGNPRISPHQVEIQPGTKGAAIARILESGGVVPDAWMFRALCLVTRSGGRLKAGEYSFPPLSTPLDVLDRILSGRVVARHVTFPEGSNLRDVARIFDQHGLASARDILRLVREPAFIEALGIQAPDLEGYLFPETYHFRKSQDAAAMLGTMTGQFFRVFGPELQTLARQTGRSVHDVVILASLIEKEAVVDEDRPLIASVFINRLKKSMPLQSDPTAIYDLPDFKGKITWLHLKRPSPYNTYFVRGLPAGPICNPGIKSIRAALYPADTKYLYFVSNADGTHRFSETLSEHNKAVSAYVTRKRQAAVNPGSRSREPVPAPSPAGSSPNTDTESNGTP